MAATHLDGRVAATRAHVAALDADALFVTHLPNVAWLTGFFSSSGAVVLTTSALILITDFRYREAVGRLDLPAGSRLEIAEGSVEVAAAELVGDLNVETLAIEAEHVTLKRYGRMQALLPKGTHLLQADAFLERLRAQKDPVEIAVYREATARLAEVVGKVPGMLQPGRQERELAALIDLELKRSGFERPAFETIVASGPNSSQPHARPTNRSLEAGDPVVLDFGGVYKGYCVDLTRTAFLGHPTQSFMRLFDAVSEAQAAALAAVRSGVYASEVDAAARSSLAAHGLDEVFGHATGHGLGIEVHEYPRVGRVTPDSDDPVLRDRMIITIEPGVYVPEVGGVRIEDDVLVGPDGAEVLTDIRRGLMTPGAR